MWEESVGEENEGSTKCICLFSLLLSSEMEIHRAIFTKVFQGVFCFVLFLNSLRKISTERLKVTFYVPCPEVSWLIKITIIIIIINELCVWHIHEVGDMSLSKYWSLKTFLFAYCNVALFILALNSYHGPAAFSGTY